MLQSEAENSPNKVNKKFLKPKVLKGKDNGRVCVVSGPVQKLRYIMRDGTSVLQYGRSAIVFLDGLYQHEDIEWFDVEMEIEAHGC